MVTEMCWGGSPLVSEMTHLSVYRIRGQYYLLFLQKSLHEAASV